jgi:CHAT domain-containing protein/tetratricopeptide (TPR) repeat protein
MRDLGLRAVAPVVPHRRASDPHRRGRASLLLLCAAAGIAGTARASAPEPADVAPWMIPRLQEIHRLTMEARLGEADRLGRELLAEAEIGHGPGSLEVARALDLLMENFMENYFGEKDLEEGKRWAERALGIKETLFGPAHPATARGLHHLAAMHFWGMYFRLGTPEEARTLLERALAIQERALGPDHFDVSVTAHALGSMLWTAHFDEIEEARRLLERSLAIREALPDEGATGPPEGAGGAEGWWNPEPWRAGETLHALADLHRRLGNYAESLQLRWRVVQIHEEVLGPDHPSFAGPVTLLAYTYLDLEDHEAALAPMRRALESWERQQPDSPRVARGLENLANVHHSLGDLDGTRALTERALGIWERRFASPSPTTGHYENLDYYLARSRLELAAIEHARGDHARARSLLERSLEVMPSDDPGLRLQVRTQLAIVLLALGEQEQALRLGRACLESFQRVEDAEFASIGPEAAWTLVLFLMKTGDHASAKVVLQRLLRDTEATDPKRVFPVQAALSEVLWLLGRVEDALELSLEAAARARGRLRLAARGLPERVALRSAAGAAQGFPFSDLRRLVSGLDVALAAAFDAPDPAATRRVWDEVILSRALVLDEMAARHRLAAGVSDPQVRGLAEEVNRARHRLAALTVRGQGDLSAERHEVLLQEVREQKDRSELALAGKSRLFRELRAREDVGFEQVARSLPENSALVAYVRFERVRPPERGATATGLGRPAEFPEPVPSYLAFVLRSGRPDPLVVPLGAAAEIDPLVSRWRQAAGQSWSAAGKTRDAGEVLRQAVWDPIAPHFGGIGRVFVVPDGALHLANLAALPSRGRYLLESGPTIHYLSAERDLVPPAEPVPAGAGLLAFGGPDFDAARLFAALSVDPPATPREVEPVARLSSPPSDLPTVQAWAFRGQRSGCGSFASIDFEPLPATAREAEEVLSLWQSGSAPASQPADSRARTGGEATEAAFKKEAPGRRTLHLATHGFFLGSECPQVTGESRGVGGVAATTQPSPDGKPRPLRENPLLLSGLALTGANHREHAGPDEEDGVLTAEEIAALDLSGVEWAVLSACDTGVGEIQAGEGVLGLRRAFQVAGARTLILSLWSVEDDSTREWMRALYEGRLSQGLDTAEAVRNASLTVLKARRERGESTHPFYWAGFVAAGDWR